MDATFGSDSFNFCTKLLTEAEFVYCGPDRYENAGTALRQLQELRLK